MNIKYCENIKKYCAVYFPAKKNSKNKKSNQSLNQIAAHLTTTSHVLILIVTGILWSSSACSSELNCSQVEQRLTPTQAVKFSLSQDACRFAVEASPNIADGPAAAQKFPASAMAEQMALYDETSSTRLMPPTMQSTHVKSPPSARRLQTRLVENRVPSVSPSAGRAIQLAPEVDAVARRHDIDPLLLHSIAHVESRHDAAAVSPVGAMGVMQVMPATARRFGVDMPAQLRDARTNLEVSAAYLKTLQKRFGNDLALILASYNAGEGAVERHGRRIPPYKETQLYVVEVLKRYGELSAVARSLQAGGTGAAEHP